jgi:hypothetical protein
MAWADKIIRGVLARLNIPLSDKELPPATQFQAIGSFFDLSALTMTVSAATRAKFIALASQVAPGTWVSCEVTESSVGLLEWVCRFVDNGPRYCNAAPRKSSAQFLQHQRLPSVRPIRHGRCRSRAAA